MALSIQNSKAEKLAREVAAQSGETITQAITRALEERLERMRGRRTAADTAAEILKITNKGLERHAVDVLIPGSRSPVGAMGNGCRREGSGLIRRARGDIKIG